MVEGANPHIRTSSLGLRLSLTVWLMRIAGGGLVEEGFKRRTFAIKSE